MPVQSKGLPNQAPNTASHHGSSQPPAGHQPQTHFTPLSRTMPVEQQTTASPPLAHTPKARKLPGATQSLRASKAEAPLLAGLRHGLKPP